MKDSKNVVIFILVVAIITVILLGMRHGDQRYKQGRVEVTGNLLEPEKGRLYEAVTVLRTVSTSEGTVIKYFLPPERVKLTEGKEYCTDRNGYPRELQFK